jgi:hypothetical protein
LDSATAAINTSSLSSDFAEDLSLTSDCSPDLDCDGGFDGWVVLVVLDFEVFKLILAE